MGAVRRKRIRRSRAPGGLRAVRLCALGFFWVVVQRFTTISWCRRSYGMGTGDVTLTENWCCVLSCTRSGSLIFNELVTRAR